MVKQLGKTKDAISLNKKNQFQKIFQKTVNSIYE